MPGAMSLGAAAGGPPAGGWPSPGEGTCAANRGWHRYPLLRGTYRQHGRASARRISRAAGEEGRVTVGNRQAGETRDTGGVAVAPRTERVRRRPWWIWAVPFAVLFTTL